MAKRQPSKRNEPTGEPSLGPLIAQALIRLGYAEVQLSKVADVVTQKTGKTLSKQRLHAILKARTIQADTLEWIARGLGVSVAELVTGNPRASEK